MFGEPGRVLAEFFGQLALLYILVERLDPDALVGHLAEAEGSELHASLPFRRSA